MTCKFCGNVIEDNSDICFICGQKVEPAAAPAEATDAFAPAAPAAPVAPVATAAPAYAAAPAAPVYAAPVASAADIKAQKKALKQAKKAAKKEGKGASGASFIHLILPAALIALTFAVQNLCYVFVAVLLAYSFLVYRSYNKAIAAENTEKAHALVNKAFSGAILGMAIACVLLIKTAFVG